MARVVAEREDVLPALAEVFRRHGFEGASIARISQATKLGKGSLYHFFPGGKDEMAEAVLAHVRDWFEVNIFRPLEDEAPQEGIARMFSGVESYFRSGQRICLVGAFALDETRDRFAEAIRAYFGRWVEVLGAALRRSGVAVADADRLAGETVAGIQGAIVLARALQDEERFRAVLETLRGRVSGS
ncbi:TetR/AcrR family transcriptional regulator [Oryzibacter oryziterrae]|uniref:TetR/AcrR family transcriptional regulator n=1 Tax=Oryzibacter oryziterrae TaxID=2766474 RepID=UPI001F420B18|nr:TetR/AcrR family transcriptional regulator [Oryzibacter oryziterrae]